MHDVSTDAGVSIRRFLNISQQELLIIIMEENQVNKALMMYIHGSILVNKVYLIQVF